jgi:hypothetical protein
VGTADSFSLSGGTISSLTISFSFCSRADHVHDKEGAVAATKDLKEKSSSLNRLYQRNK